MSTRTIEELMVPLDEYPSVGETATLADAVAALEAAQRQAPEGRSPYRAVLVVDRYHRVRGKLGQLAFLRALESRYELPERDLTRLEAAGLGPELIGAMRDHQSFFAGDLDELCARRRTLRVTEVMHPVAESVDVGAPLGQAIHRLIASQQLSLLVTRHGQAVGLLRLAELFDEVVRQLRNEG